MLRKMREGVEAAAALAAGAVDGQLSGSAPDQLSLELDVVEEQLQRLLKELKTFIGGMNSMCGAALTVADCFKDLQQDEFADQVSPWLQSHRCCPSARRQPRMRAACRHLTCAT
eukprot:SAG31_NODE_9095_length_1336_cov_0.923201_1_plen_114_part_00